MAAREVRHHVAMHDIDPKTLRPMVAACDHANTGPQHGNEIVQ
jgi:hypothetical protein